MTETDAAAGHEQRASWLELFFDLVVVVAVAALAERLHGDSSPFDVGLVITLYLAIWLVWVSFMLYANVAGDSTHRQTMIIAMGCIAVMAAAIPGVRGEGASERGGIFAIAYIAARVLAMNVWKGTNRALVDWPVAQMSVGMVPWIVSIWVHGDVRYGLWALGLLLDIGFAVLRGGNADLLLGAMRRDRGREKGVRGGRESPARSGGRTRGRGATTTQELATDASATPQQPQLTVAEVNVSHFDERLGIFMIIVLGEAVSQIILAASGRDWTHGLARAAGCAFLLLVGLWWLTFQYGFATSPESRLARMPARFGLPLHFLSTASIVFLAAGLGETVADPLARMATGPRWLAAGGLAGYFLVNALGATAIGASREWLLGWALPSTLLALGVGAFGGALAGWGVALVLLAGVGWQVGYGFLRERGQPAVLAGSLSAAGRGGGAAPEVDAGPGVGDD